MRFLRPLFSRFVSWASHLRAKAAGKVAGDGEPVPRELASFELVTHFIFSERHFHKSTGRPHLNAFMPPRSRQLSVVHSTGLAEREIWQVGQLTIGSSPGRTEIRARADVPVACFNTHSLSAIRDDKPFERHTSIVGWPDGQDESQTKAHWKEICLQLSLDERICLVRPSTAS